MEISGKPINGQMEAYLDQVQEKSKTAPAQETQQTPSATGDRVNLSDSAKLIQQAKKTLEETPDVDMEKVQRLQNEIANGTYKADGETVSDALLRESLINMNI